MFREWTAFNQSVGACSAGTNGGEGLHDQKLLLVSTQQLNQASIQVHFCDFIQSIAAGVDYSLSNLTLSLNNTVRRRCFMVELVLNASTELLEDNERFFIRLSNPVPEAESDVRFDDGSEATVVITDVSGGLLYNLAIRCSGDSSIHVEVVSLWVDS